jgi:hypothetical protein
VFKEKSGKGDAQISRVQRLRSLRFQMRFVIRPIRIREEADKGVQQKKFVPLGFVIKQLIENMGATETVALMNGR